MKSNRGRDTSIELAVRQLLHRRGLRYRVDFRILPRLRSRADIVFLSQRVAVYLDGCFWHQCPVHGTIPKTNPDYWAPKLHRNTERDAETTEALSREGWTVMRFWEHESPTAVADSIEVAVRQLQTLRRHG
jgi:DNA mismatch endonuclease (patch repair protein)